MSIHCIGRDFTGDRDLPGCKAEYDIMNHPIPLQMVEMMYNILFFWIIFYNSFELIGVISDPHMWHKVCINTLNQ